MGKIGFAFLSAVIGGLSAVAAVVCWAGWGAPVQGTTHLDPTRADYVDLLLTLVTICLAAVGLAVTVGALVIGLVALKTLREIKDDAATAAKDAAAKKIMETMDAQLEPNVNAKVSEALPPALKAALLNDELGHRILKEMAQRGDFDDVLERVAVRMQGGGPEPDPEYEEQYIDEEGDQA